MVFNKKIRELKSYITLWGERFKISKAEMKLVDKFMDAWAKEVCSELNVVLSPEATIGISDNPSVRLDKQPKFKYIPEGFYKTRTGELLIVEVLHQHKESGLVTTADVNNNQDVISGALFARIFQPCNT